MAPEQVSGREVDERADIYSLAAVCYLALTGRGVTVESDLDRVFVDVVRNPPPPVSDLVPGVPPELDEAFRTALAKNPAERPRDVVAWARALAGLLEELSPATAGWVLPPLTGPARGPASPTLVTTPPAV
jgi:serine/threonine protein kinase